MKKVLLVCAHRPGRSPSQRYRFEQYLTLLEKEGFRFTYSFLLDEQSDRLFYAPGNFFKKILILLGTITRRIADIKRINQFDIIFIQREASFFGLTFFEKAAARSKAFVIFDFDDSIWLADTSPANKKWEWTKDPKKFYSNIKLANLVIAGNAYLFEKAYGRNQNTVIIPTTIDTNIHVVLPDHRNKEVLTIGWSGSVSTIKHFNALVPILKKIKAHYKEKIQFKIIADRIYTHPDLEIVGVKWNSENEVNELNSFDIGLMPLPDDEWSRGKCGLKGLSYMACGVATIMSAVGVNGNIIRNNENGLLAETDDDWYAKLCFLIENRNERQRLGLQGRKTVEEEYSVQANFHKYLEAFKSAE